MRYDTQVPRKRAGKLFSYLIFYGQDLKILICQTSYCILATSTKSFKRAN